MTAPRVIVVGAGVTGLTAAVTLQDDARRAGVPLSIEVLEASAQIGGHAQTTAVDGLVVEHGPNGFLNREPHTLALIEMLGLESRLVEARPESKRRFIVRDGGLKQVPDGPASLVTSPALSWRAKLRLLGEPFAAARPEGDESIHAFATRRLGAEVADMLVDTAVAGISAGDSRRLSLAAQFPRLAEMERAHGSLLRAMFAPRPPGAAPGPSRLLSFDRGMGVLTSTMAARLGDAATAGVAVQTIERRADGWMVRGGDGTVREADHVVVAAPARHAAGMVTALDAPLANALQGIEYAGLTVVALAYGTSDIPRALDGYGYLVTRPEGLATLGVVWESSLFPGRAPDGVALLRVMLGGSRRPDVVTVPAAEHARLARADLQTVLGITAEPRYAAVHAWPAGIAQYTIGHQARVHSVQSAMARHQGLWLCGTSYDGVSFNDAVKSGRLTARRVASEIWGERDRDHGSAAAEDR